MLYFFFISSSFANPPQPLVFPLARILKGDNIYFSTITAIDWNDTEAFISGTTGDKKSISGAVIKDIFLHCKAKAKDPECLIEHTQAEDLAYADFHEQFRMRPTGSDGLQQVFAWDRNKFKQCVLINNCEKNSAFSKMLFDADFTFKKMIMDKKRIPGGMESFVGFAKNHLLQSMEKNSGFGGYTFETIFYVTPLTIRIHKRSNNIEVKSVSFIVIPKGVYTGETGNKGALEKKWAETFSENFNTISAKTNEFTILTEAYKMFALLKLSGVNVAMNDYGKLPQNFSVPDSIPSFKTSKIIDVPDPLINEPGRYKFMWFMISGGIFFKSPGEGVSIIED